MENKIEVGEWIRLKDGRIRIFKNMLDKENVELTRPYNIARITDIVKHSKNIIDIIEVGDVLKIQRGLYSKSKIIIEDEDTLISIQENIKKCNIKSIVTHEQFASVEYKV